MKTKKGFTLIELLVVIAIIAILAAILFPVFARARDKARQTTCLSNCKQIALGILMYTDDYDEVFPAVMAHLDVPVPTPTTDLSFNQTGNDPNVHPDWTVVAAGEYCMSVNFQTLILPYIRTTKIFHCPNDQNFPDSDSYWANSLASSGGGSPMGGPDWNAWRAVAATTDPGGTILVLCTPLDSKWDDTLYPEWGSTTNPPVHFFDGGYTHILYSGISDKAPFGLVDGAAPGNRLDLSHPWNACVINDAGNSPCAGGLLCSVWPVSAYGGASPWTQVHNGGTNYAFADGHAKWYRIEQTVAPHNMWTIDPTD